MSSKCSKSERNSKKVDQHELEIESAELVVMMADECHLLAGDSCGYGWGKSSERLVVQVANAKQRQTYFGALNPKSGELIVSEAACANSETTVCFLEALRRHYPGNQLWVIWDNASYHKSQKVQAYLKQINGQLPSKQWPITLLNFAPNAPEQNPIEQVWLQGKTQIRKQAGLDCFQKVKQFFVDSITENAYSFEKFKWYGF